MGAGIKNRLIISWYLYVYAFMPVCTMLSCMALILYGAFEFYLWPKKIGRPGGLLLPGLNWHVNHVSVGGIPVLVCVCQRSMTYL